MDGFPNIQKHSYEWSDELAGFGTHSDPVIAATRAITEANQARMISISGSREDMNKNFYLLSAALTKGNKEVKESSVTCKMRKTQDKGDKLTLKES